MFVFICSSLSAGEKTIFKAVYFYKNNCSECETVLKSTLPALKEKYGDQLEILAVNNGSSKGGDLYLNGLLEMGISFSHNLPLLLMHKSYLSGYDQISKTFPELIGEKLKYESVDWPHINGLKELLVEIDQQPLQGQIFWIKAGQSNWIQLKKDNVIETFNRDFVGNTVAVFVLLGMIICIIGTFTVFIKTEVTAPTDFPIWIIPVLSLVGLFISGYMTYTGMSNTKAVCGPIGDCNTVQQSSYSYLFGIFRVSVLGFISYLMILVNWCFKIFGPLKLKGISTLSVFGISTLGVLFFIYLTFLEPFVIGASCAWCLSAAIVMTAIMVTSVFPARLSKNELWR